ncbi:MAG: hypothetical protein NT139_02425 [Candidatus Woesearchaeota archaeon]|nr:hypothetical protein [Candidatus Woesearchaeota archaeon]
MKKGELLSQPFTYIFALVLMGILFFFGYRAIAGFQEKAQLIELTTFVNDLKYNIKTYYNFDTGSSKQLNLNIPKKIQRICFTNLNENTATTDPCLKLLVSKNNNLYICPVESFSINTFKIDYLMVSKSPLCFDVNGKFNAKITKIISNKKPYIELTK